MAGRTDPAGRLAEETRLPEQCQDGREGTNSSELPAHRPAYPGHRLCPGCPAARAIRTFDAKIADVDAQITELFRQHDSADVLLTMPGFGSMLAATFLAHIGGNLAAFDSVDRLASVAGLAPVPRDCGRISGNLHRPRRFNRRLLRTCYHLAALSSLKNSPASRTYYDRKRGEGKSHKQALIALARRRLNVLWAMLRDHTMYQEPTPRITAQAA